MAPAKPFTLPTPQQRVSIYGRTGSGKSQQAVWYLSKSNYEHMPWLAIDFKGDDLINAIPYAHHIGFNTMPEKPGIYILHPRYDQAEELENYLWRIYDKENMGVFVDEAFMMPQKGAYQALITQGRQKHIPMINVTQKPCYVPMHVLSEADYHSIFELTDSDDHKRVGRFTKYTREELERPLPEYVSHVYRVKDKMKFELSPVPDADRLLADFEQRLAPKRRLV